MGVYVRSVAVFSNFYGNISLAGWGILKWPQVGYFGWPSGDSPAGMEKLDSICMLLIAIGEALKNLEKATNKTLLLRYPQVDWKKAKGMRDIISHHYFEADAEVIYDVCKNNIVELAQSINQIIQDVS